MAYSQQKRLLSLSTPLGEDTLLLIGLEGIEGISQPSRFILDTISEYDIEEPLLQGQSINFDYELDDGSFRVFNGIVDKITCLGIVNQHFRRYQLHIITKLDMMNKSSDCKIHQQQSQLDIIKGLCEEHHLDVQNGTFNDYPVREMDTQYQEFDDEYLHRLLKEAGINYTIQHDTGKHTLFLFDQKSRYVKATEPLIQYVDGSTDQRHFYHWQKTMRATTPRTVHRSFDFLRPYQPVKSQTNTLVDASVDSAYEHYHYPAINLHRQDSDRENARRMDEIENNHIQLQVSTDCRTLAPGQMIKFERHRLDDSERQNTYVITQIHYVGKDDTYLNQPDAVQTLECHLTCIPAEIMYRDPTPRPRPCIPGMQTAIVSGPTHEEIFTDELGRVKVQFHWDRDGKRDENSSPWIRVAQPLAGKGFGTQYIPRTREEVLVFFEDGDINKPLICGSAYNGKHHPPLKLPANKTQTGIKSRSTKGADPAMFNELRFEDKKGEEEVYLQAQKDQSTVVKDSQSRLVGRDQNLSVGGNRTEVINNNRSSVISEGSDSLQVQKNINMLSVTGDIFFEGAEFIELKAGSSSLSMRADGSIQINANKVEIEGESSVNLNAKADVIPDPLYPIKLDNIFTTPAVPGSQVAQNFNELHWEKLPINAPGAFPERRQPPLKVIVPPEVDVEAYYGNSWNTPRPMEKVSIRVDEAKISEQPVDTKKGAST